MDKYESNTRIRLYTIRHTNTMTHAARKKKSPLEASISSTVTSIRATMEPCHGLIRRAVEFVVSLQDSVEDSLLSANAMHHNV